jgi:hypothetical protein
MPTFMVFKNGTAVETVKGADPQKLQAVVKKLAAEADDSSSGGFGEASGSGSGGDNNWMGTSLPRGYRNVTDQVDVRGLDLLNADAAAGTARSLFEGSRPQGLNKGKAKEGGDKDWVESDTDEQLMLFVPFQSTLKVHTLHITSLPPPEGDDEAPMRPRTIRIYSNRTHCLDFAEAEGTTPTQEVVLEPGDWDAETGTAKAELRFVKFQNVTSLVLFIVDGDGDGEKVRVDRIRIVGDAGEKRDMGKLEKVGDES